MPYPVLMSVFEVTCKALNKFGIFGFLLRFIFKLQHPTAMAVVESGGVERCMHIDKWSLLIGKIIALDRKAESRVKNLWWIFYITAVGSLTYLFFAFALLVNTLAHGRPHNHIVHFGIPIICFPIVAFSWHLCHSLEKLILPGDFINFLPSFLIKMKQDNDFHSDIRIKLDFSEMASKIINSKTVPQKNRKISPPPGLKYHHSDRFPRGTYLKEIVYRQYEDHWCSITASRRDGATLNVDLVNAIDEKKFLWYIPSGEFSGRPETLSECKFVKKVTAEMRLGLVQSLTGKHVKQIQPKLETHGIFMDKNLQIVSMQKEIVFSTDDYLSEKSISAEDVMDMYKNIEDVIQKGTH